VIIASKNTPTLPGVCTLLQVLAQFSKGLHTRMVSNGLQVPVGVFKH